VECAITGVSADTVTVVLEEETIPVKRSKVLGLQWLREDTSAAAGAAGRAVVSVAGGGLRASRVEWSADAFVIDVVAVAVGEAALGGAAVAVEAKGAEAALVVGAAERALVAAHGLDVEVAKVGARKPDFLLSPSGNETLGVPATGTPLNISTALRACPIPAPSSKVSLLAFRYQSGSGPLQVV
jgi:hypothetical protein